MEFEGEQSTRAIFFNILNDTLRGKKMKNLKLTLIAGLSVSGLAQANFTGDMSRIDADQLSGNDSGTVNANCSANTGEWDGASAKITSTQAGGTSRVSVKVHGAKPDTHMTLWVRLKGKSHNE